MQHIVKMTQFQRDRLHTTLLAIVEYNIQGIHRRQTP